MEQCKFTFGQVVIIKNGFYRGYGGHISDVRTCGFWSTRYQYRVFIDLSKDASKEEWIMEKHLAPFKGES